MMFLKKNQPIYFIERVIRNCDNELFGDESHIIYVNNDDDFPIGTSEYGISNTNIAAIVYGDPTHKVRIPSNLSIIGTMLIWSARDRSCESKCVHEL